MRNEIGIEKIAGRETTTLPKCFLLTRERSYDDMHCVLH